LLIPEYGILGAAIAHAISLALRNIMALVQINRILGMWAFTRQTAEIAVVSLSCFGVAPAILHVVGAAEIWVVVSIVFGAIVYTTWAWKSRRALQLDTFGNALRRRTASRAP
jgi:hypothetical protein